MKQERTRVHSASEIDPASALAESSRLPTNGRPRLLVSVRSSEEATDAIAGGAEILDVKEPSRGSLGMSSVHQIAQIARTISSNSAPVPLSVALGEAVEWVGGTRVPALPAGIQFAKLGLSQFGRRAGWANDWIRVRDEFQSRSSSKLNWVAVAYVDAREADSPDVDEIIGAAIDSGCRGILLDTFSKGEKNLLSWVDAEFLLEIADRCHSASLFLAIAGKLSLDSISALSQVPADIIAIRSAACRGTDRTAEICAERIAEFRSSLRQTFKFSQSIDQPFSLT